MNKHIGLWIDHRRAVIVSTSSPADEFTVVLSEVEKDPSSPIPEDSQDRKYQNQLNVYFDEVIGHVCNAESLLIFGPGEAKGEFAKRLERQKPSERDVKSETTDKMSDRQVVAYVRSHFDRERNVIPV